MHIKPSLSVALILALGLGQLPVLSAHDTARTFCQERPRMEVAFVLDTTGSMGGMIAGAKQKIWAIANKLKSAEPTPEIRFGLVGYRDRGDQYVTKISALSSNLDAIYSQLNALEAQGGGDEPESVNAALHQAVRDLQWSTDSSVLRVIFLVGDARPHMDYQDDVKYTETCQLANRRGILINTLQCGQLPGTETVWRDIARLTNGTYAAIGQSGGSIRIETSYDLEIVRLNAALDATIIPYGSRTEQENATRNRAVLASLSAEGVADRSSYLSKDAPGAVISGRGDLVTDLLGGRQELSAVESNLLDPKLQDLPVAERNELITRKTTERRALQAELLSVLAKRDAAAEEKLKALAGREGVLELNAYQALEAQAKEKGYRFEKKP